MSELSSVTAASNSDGDFRYILNDGNATIYSYTGPGGDVIIPSTVSNGTATFPVTGIGTGAFMGMENLTSISIPDGISSIGDYAFYGCSALGYVTVPQSVTYLGSYSFYECTGLSSAAVLGNITAIRYATFASCFNLTHVSLPDSIRSIVGYAFIYCASLKEIDIPDGVGNIGPYAFFNCPLLETVHLPDSISVVDDYAFMKCSAMSTLTLGSGLDKLGDGAFMECSSLTEITMPDGLTGIGIRCFAYCSNLTSLTFLGDAPNCGQEWALDAGSNITVVSIDGNDGFTTPTWQGLSSVRVAVPDAPLHLSATSSGGSVKLSWQAPPSTGNASIVRYEIFFGLDGNSSNWSSYGSVGGSATSVTIAGLTIGATYHLSVKAVNLAGNSTFSDQLVFKVHDQRDPGLLPFAIVLFFIAVVSIGYLVWRRSRRGK